MIWGGGVSFQGFRGKPLPGNRDNLMEGFEGFSVFSNDFNGFLQFLLPKNAPGVFFWRGETGPCQATATTTRRAFEGFLVNLMDSNSH